MFTFISMEMKFVQRELKPVEIKPKITLFSLAVSNKIGVDQMVTFITFIFQCV